MPNLKQIGFLLFVLLALFGLSYSASDLSFSAWLKHIEQWNAPHFMRGAILGLVLWIIGLKWVQPKFGLKAAVFSLTGLLVFSVCWEIRDQLYSVWGGSDPFDPVDILFDLLGWLYMQAVHLATELWD